MSISRITVGRHRLAAGTNNIFTDTKKSIGLRFRTPGRTSPTSLMYSGRKWTKKNDVHHTFWGQGNQEKLATPSRLFFSTNSTKSDTATSTSSASKRGPAKVRTPKMATTATWERAAKRVKNTEVEKNNAYMQEIRAAHDPSMHLKTIEDELKETIGAALGRQGRKILQAMELMQTSYDEYESALAEHEAQHTNIGTSNSSSAMDRAKEAAVQYNKHRQQAVTARWELQVHRQAVGFVTNNHNTLREHYPIPEALPVDENGNEIIPDKNQKSFDKFGDQLDWWQKVGRWK